ncbi:sedoheptulose 7-phosphate cyclase [Sphaerisporangium sp. TRM90804]|uniref:sedoheptulose 7-phosphate cyclase n=1 Tax=Sphaerisporangium sp. TRM90804 TaxID=3031113 RepID=UPI00244A590C|nr:sedoheptulose 7-phosphate cyclase [Sphaerisporangium sp. TRM90804]MDH2427316.1 sedoheptulose 7-phosphate cyclase [Sphaerisporangium sp. TRM90804]
MPGSAQVDQVSEQGLFSSGGAAEPSWRLTTRQPVSYEVRLHSDLLDPADPALADAGTLGGPATRRRLLVVESTVHELYGYEISAYFTAQKVEHETVVISAHEQVKTMDLVMTVVAAMDRFGIVRRAEPVIAFGGGVLTDVVGLAASLYRRSTPHVRVPTTLMGMIDAGVGAKTGVNLGHHKNRLGAYHPALTTLIDRSFLRTLSERHMANGLAEILKMALVKDAALLDLLEGHGERLIAERMQGAGSLDGGACATEVIRRAIQGMLSELQPNLWEHRLTRLVDYGHSFSPAVEMHALPELLHGEAVCVDMAFCTVLARRRGWLTREQQDRVIRLMRELRLPSWHPVCTPDLITTALQETVRHRDGRQRLPLPVGFGEARFVDDLTEEELAGALAELRSMGHRREDVAA